MEQIPKNPESVSITLTQTAKGYWYVDRLKAEGGDTINMLAHLDTLISEVLRRLKDLNSPSETEVENENGY